MQRSFPRKATGFAAPTQGYEEQGIDLNRLLIRNPPATYFVRLDSSDMEHLGLPKNTLLIVDRSLPPKPDNIVMICHQGQFYCRLMVKTASGVTFTNGEEEIKPIQGDTQIIGVITASIKTHTNED